MFGNVICKGCRTYIHVSKSCALAITDVEKCPCPVCLVKGMCNVMCAELDELLLQEAANRLRNQIDEDIIREIIESTRRDDEQQ